MTFFDILGQILVLLGGLVFATAGLGILRFPDTYTRASAVGTAAGIGVVFVVLGALLLQPTIPDLIKVLVIVPLQLATSAVGSIVVARSAYLTGVRMKRRSFDELADAGSEEAN